MPKLSPQAGILGGTFFFVTALAIYTILVPLRLLALEFSLSQIGVVAATSALISFLGQLPGGAFCDRRGQRLPIALSFLFMSIVGTGMLFSNTLPMFMLTMVFRGLAGSLYWPSSQSYVSLIDPSRAAVYLGRQTSTIAIASISGALIAGYVASFYGFNTAFSIAIILSLMGMLLSYLTPKLHGTAEHGKGKRFVEVLKTAGSLLSASRLLQLAILCAFLAATPHALVGSFYPVYFVSLGYDERMVGILSALLELAVFVTGMAFGFLHSRYHSKTLLITSLLGIGFSMILLAGGAPVFPAIILQGFALGLAAVLSVLLASEAAGNNGRGATIGVMEMGFCTALFVIPLSFGFALEKVDYVTVFLILGTILIILGLIFAAANRLFPLNNVRTR